MSTVGKITIGLLLVIVAVVFVTKTCFLNMYRIPQNGMYPTIKSNGLLFARLNPYKNVSQVKRGDVIVFKQVEEEEQLTHIWRVVALPGDAVQILGENVTINGEPLKHERVRQEDKVTVYREINGSATYEIAFDAEAKAAQPPARLTVPANHLYVLGDNRCEAHDSRYLGPIKFETVTGKKL